MQERNCLRRFTFLYDTVLKAIISFSGRKVFPKDLGPIPTCNQKQLKEQNKTTLKWLPLTFFNGRRKGKLRFLRDLVINILLEKCTIDAGLGKSVHFKIFIN